MLLGHQAAPIAGKPVSLASSGQIAGMLGGLGSEALAKKRVSSGMWWCQSALSGREIGRKRAEPGFSRLLWRASPSKKILA
jgi:hypothetical protein